MKKSRKIKFEEMILHETDHLLFVNKPPHLSSLHERDLTRQSVIALAQEYDPALSLVHRLDKETSGVLLLAKSDEAYRHCSIEFELRRVKKFYHAVTDATANFKDLAVELPIHQIGKGTVKIDRTLGKLSKTIFNTLKHYNKYTLVEAQPVTGRMHQIRIHLSKQHAPIVADEAYGGKKLYLSKIKRKYKPNKKEEERPIMQRVALHAHALMIEDVDGKQVKVEAPYPKDFAVLIKVLEKYSSK